LNYDPLQITVHARLLGHSILARSTGRLKPEMLANVQVVFSPVRLSPGRKPVGVNTEPPGKFPAGQKIISLFYLDYFPPNNK
jgi:hypothetical protein